MNVVRKISIKIKDIIVELNSDTVTIKTLAGIIAANYPKIINVLVRIKRDDYDLLNDRLGVSVAVALISELKEMAELKGISTKKWRDHSNRKKKFWEFKILDMQNERIDQKVS